MVRCFNCAESLMRSAPAADWLERNASGVWHGEALLCDRRYAPQLLQAAKSHGLTAEAES